MEPGQRFGEYVLGHRLGAGGQGEVFEARDAIGMVWALKIGHPVHTDDQRALARFVREAQWVNTTLGALPRNCGLLVGEHYGVHEHRFYVKMRMIQGESLAQRLKRREPLSAPEAVSLARKIAEVVAIAHENNAIHRDLKPENVLLETDGGTQVVDWGCIHLVEAGQLAQSGAGPLCTLGYAAPEQYDLKNPPTAATDIYALGVMLFEMLTGYNPFLDSWRNPERAATSSANNAGVTRTAAPLSKDTRAATGLYPTLHAGNVREGSPDAITRSTAATSVVPLEERLVDFPEPQRSSFELNSTAGFRPMSIAEVLGRQLTFDIDRFRALTEPLPERLIHLLDSMLKPRADERPASMTDVVATLDLIAAGLNSERAKVGIEHRSTKNWRLGAVLGAALVMGGAAVWWLAESNADATAQAPAPLEGARVPSAVASAPAAIGVVAVPPSSLATKADVVLPLPTPAPGTEGATTSKSTADTSASDPSPSVEPSARGTTTAPKAREKRVSRSGKDDGRAASSQPSPPFADLPYFESQRRSSP